MPDSVAAKRGRLLVVQRRLTHYRLPFFEGVRSKLEAADIDLTLAVGNPTAAERNKRDEGHLDWAVHVPCTYALDGRLCWQSLGSLLPQHDMVVVTQENKLLNNLPLLLGRQRCRVGSWGHGRNFQAAGNQAAGVAQRLKAALSRRADWWFAYTEVSAEIVRDFGYPAGRITVLNNAIDTAGLAAAVAQARLRSKEELRMSFGLAPGGPMGLYLGSLYPEKRLDLLVDGAMAVQVAHPDFQLAVVGAGPQEAWLRARVAGLPWVHVLGSRHGAEKAELLACADVMLNPGLVGLGILDAFVAGLPLVTTDCHLHSPEIAYLQPGNNGLMTAPDAAGFAAALIQIIDSPALADHLRQGCAQSAVAYSMAAMVDRFCDGVLAWNASERLSKLPSLGGA